MARSIGNILPSIASQYPTLKVSEEPKEHQIMVINAVGVSMRCLHRRGFQMFRCHMTHHWSNALQTSLIGADTWKHLGMMVHHTFFNTKFFLQLSGKKCNRSSDTVDLVWYYIFFCNHKCVFWLSTMCSELRCDSRWMLSTLNEILSRKVSERKWICFIT